MIHDFFNSDDGEESATDQIENEDEWDDRGAELRADALSNLAEAHVGFIFTGTFPTEENDVDEFDTTVITFHLDGLTTTEQMAGRWAMEQAAERFHEEMNPGEGGGPAGDIAKFLAAAKRSASEEGDENDERDDGTFPSGSMFQ